MDRTALGALLIAIGLTAGGWFVGQGFARGRATDRYVTVKGVAEREVKADLALWPIGFVAAANDLGQVQGQIAASAGKVREFLRTAGIDPAQAAVQDYNVTDTQANAYGGDRAPNRFIIRQSIMVRSAEPDTIFAASQKVSDLVNAGVVLSAEGGMGGSGPTYLFTKLNEIKPAMIAEATASARQAAEQFAKDSGSRLGSIRQANQGVFEILPRDRAPGATEESQRAKTVRVVTTVEYYLRD
jgi:hypothetical protein